MVSAFVREGKHYTKDEICELFNLDHYQWALFSGRLAGKGILKMVSKADMDEDGFDIEDEDDRETDKEMYKFTYVGIIVYKDWILKCYPKYIKTFDEKILSEKLRLVLQVIRKDKSYNIKLRFMDESDDDNGGRLNLIMYMLDDYFENGIYSNDSDILEINGSGEIDWNRTVNYSNPIISNGYPYYVEMYTKRRIVNDYDYFRRLHECILSRCSKELEGYGLVDIVGASTVDLSDDEISDFGDVDYIVYRLNNEKNVQFNTRKLILLDYMERYIKEKYTSRGRDAVELYGTRAFHVVWEDVCSAVFDSQLKKPIKELKLPFGIKEQYKRFKNLLDIIEKPKWGVNRVEASKTLIPDLISFRRTKDSFDFIIFDAKYYNILIEDNKVAGQPGVEDLTKQYSYQMAYWDFLKDNNITTVRNCFLMPTDKDYVITDKGAATLDMYSRLGLEDIRIRLLPAMIMYKKFISGSLYDIGELEL